VCAPISQDIMYALHSRTDLDMGASMRLNARTLIRAFLSAPWCGLRRHRDEIDENPLRSIVDQFLAGRATSTPEP
jgi:hypothetical protein